MTSESFHYRARKRIAQAVSRSATDGQLAKFETKDWDVAIVLDACRADTLQQVTNWPIDTVRSPASCTPEWVKRVGEAEVFCDATVVSGNPQYEKYESKAKTVEPYWESHWDDSLRTILPEPMLDRVTELLRENETPVVAHIMQPHWPYIAHIGDSWRLAYDNLYPWHSEDGQVDSVQVGMERGLVDVSQATQAYRASVESIWQTLLPYIEQWSNDATVVVTGDHGEAFGGLADLGFYEHPCGIHIRSLTEVPWVTFEPLSAGDSSGDIEEQLKALGYA